ncbi:MAG: RluA family pseudouridine synthase [Candidatus Izemoplasmatales bacterium]|nr:RluA family pseudouridine synthase [Candidatus Izemoplasmatales bacterium]MDD4070634.1 RluA family pseudouridine synthase [Candidatus Izemoplasmatales bacterium]
MSLDIVFEDNHIIVVKKPAGVLSQAGSLDLPDMLNEIKNYLKIKYQKPGNVYLGLVHRLDTNVGGVMVFAKTSKAASRLSEQIRENLFNKNYLAVVKGSFPIKEEKEIVDYLEKNEEKKIAEITSKGKISKLRYIVVDNQIIDGETYSLLKIELETGRFHQIRAQLSNLGHPIYNDGKYGVHIKGYNLGLFAYKIGFLHPTLKQKMEFSILPNDDVFNYFSNSIRKMEDIT